MKRKEIDACALALPGATLDFPFGDTPIYKVCGKMFAASEAVKPGVECAVSFKCSDMSFALLTEREGIAPAPYLQRAKWVRVEIGAMDADEIKERLAEAHRLIVAKLPKKAQSELLGDVAKQIAPKQAAHNKPARKR
ncbi:MAG: MmcQ/YjbR family DNA-binding protein [Caulobacterales bacterium]